MRLVAGTPNQAVDEKWPVAERSFKMPSGKRWLTDLRRSTCRVETESGFRHVTYPHRDAPLNLVLRKIVGKLNAYHGFGDCNGDELAKAGPVPSMFTTQERAQMLSYSLGTTSFGMGSQILKNRTFACGCCGSMTPEILWAW